MYRFFSNSVTKLKNLSLQNLLTETNYKNEFNFCDVRKLSHSHLTNANTKGNNKVINFEKFVTTRRTQAERSILVQVNSHESFKDLQRYCSQFGTIIGGHHYQLAKHDYILIEYSSKLEAQQAIQCSTRDETSGPRVHSPFFWFRAGKASKEIIVKPIGSTGKLMVTNGCQPIDYKVVNSNLFGAKSVSDQMVILHKLTALNDLGIRMRFLAARQIEESMSGIFPNMQAFVFGSTVNGYGKSGCDLDLILHSIDQSENDLTKRLVCRNKTDLMGGRSQIQRSLQNLSDTMEMYLPGVANVRRILNARVPIIRYHHSYMDFEVDVTANNMSGLYMSELLYMFGQIDERVSPLVYTIRRWAQTNSITNAHPGVWISNFSLTCLVIFYLQQVEKPVLPSINTLIAQARPQDKRTCENEDGMPCTFLRDLNLLKFKKENKDSLDRLLFGFFEFYSLFNLKERAISLNDGKIHFKPDRSALYIINPLEPALNVSRNVSTEEGERFVTEVKNAAWWLDVGAQNIKSIGKKEPWGLLKLFEPKRIFRSTDFYTSRILNVEYLSNDTDTDTDTNRKIKFKNRKVRKEIGKIQKDKLLALDTLKSRGKL